MRLLEERLAQPTPVGKIYTAEELEKLPGMRADTAARILELRSQAGAFRNPEDLRRALGMEKAEFEKILYLFKYSD